MSRVTDESAPTDETCWLVTDDECIGPARSQPIGDSQRDGVYAVGQRMHLAHSKGAAEDQPWINLRGTLFSFAP